MHTYQCWHEKENGDHMSFFIKTNKFVITILATGLSVVTLFTLTSYAFPVDNFTTLLISSDNSDGDTTIVDTSPYNQTIVRTGDVQHKTTQKKFGTSALYFDGSGDKLDGIPLADTFAEDSFTIDVWVYVSSTGGFGRGIIGCLSGRNAGWAVAIQGPVYSDRRVALFTNSSWVLATTELITLDDWNHIAVVKDGANGVDIAVNGVFTNTPYTGTLTYFGTDITIGNMYPIPPNTVWDHSGFIDEFRISKGVARWNEAFTPPSEPYATPPSGNTIKYEYDEAGRTVRIIREVN